MNRKFYIADEPEDFAYGQASEVEARDIQSAAEDEAARIFDEDGVDPMRPVEVIVARDEHGRGAVRYSIRRHVEVTHEVESEEDVEVPLACDLDGYQDTADIDSRNES